MGLDCSPGDFSIGYMGFNMLRKLVAIATGGMWPPHSEEDQRRFHEQHPEQELKPTWWYVGDDYDLKSHPGMNIFLLHSDCDGEISPTDCVLVARDLQAIMPEFMQVLETEVGDSDYREHYAAKLRQFIEVCQLATDQNEPLVFH